MKKGLVLGLILMMVFVVGGGIVEGQGCGPTPWPVGCLGSLACAYTKCIAEYDLCDTAATSICYACVDSCSGDPSEIAACVAACFATYSTEVISCQAQAFALQESIITNGIFETSIVPCNEINHCLLKNVPGTLKSFDRLGCAGIDLKTYVKIITEYGASNPSEIAWNTPLSVLADESIRAAMANVGMQIPALRQIELYLYMAYNVYTNPYIRIPLTLASLGQLISGKLSQGDDKDQAAFRNAASNDATTDITTTSNSQAIGTSSWVYCSPKLIEVKGYEKCENYPVCVKNDAEQCVAVLPGGGDVKVTFGSIHIIDKKLNNMFTLTGSENKGVVYQPDGFVNIDKGGTTKMSVAGEGAAITDYKSNQLFIGKGTTFYFGTGNEHSNLYLTNSFVFDSNSKVAVDAVNGIEQNKFKTASRGELKQNIELALTFDQFELNPYKNSIDISKLQTKYQILTRGFSNMILLEKEKLFPLVTRNFAKGGSLIVNYKNVKVPNIYIVDDGNYQYTIKTVGDSTRVIAKDEKIIQDSGPMGKKLSKKQSLLVYRELI